MSAHLACLKQSLGNGSLKTQYAIERIQAELDFAETLCELHPAQAGVWRLFIAKACRLVESGAADLPTAIATAEQTLAPLAKIAKDYTIYCVGHGHIDMNWTWSWPETVAVTNDTFSTVLRLMDEFPTFHYSQSQASVYAIIEQHHPELLAKIAARVREGRWEVTASHWVENDANLAGSEALCRHLLYTRRYMQKLFGLKPEDIPINWAPDTFGHAATVPTYLRRGGVKYEYLHRPGTHTLNKPRAFWWDGPDGARVLVKNDMEVGYNGQITPSVAGHLAKFTRETGLPFTIFVYGVGDHGGGPTRRDLLRALDMNAWPVFPNLTFARARTFFERLEKEGKKLPVVEGELNFEFTGCYTTQTLIKKANRYGEKRLAQAEVANALNWAAFGRAYPQARFEEGWRDTLFSHFHDILPGSGVHDTRTYTHGLYQKTMAMTSMEESKALRYLASRIDTSFAGPVQDPPVPPSHLPTALGSGVGQGAADGALSTAEQSAGIGHRPFLVFNPTADARDEIVEATVWDNFIGWRRQELNSIPFSVRLPDGEMVAAQTVETGNFWGHDFVRLAFPAKVGSLGYGLFTIMEKKGPEAKTGVRQLGMGHHCFYAATERSREGLENDLVRVELDMTTGGIRSLLDKRSGVELISPANPAPVLEYAVERPHGMTAWCLDHTNPAERGEVLNVSRRLHGPYKASLDVKLRFHESEFTVTYELRASDPSLYLHIAGTWFQRGMPQTNLPVLRLAFPLNLDGAKGRYEIPFGAIDRALNSGEELPALRWAQVSGLAGKTPAGCLLLNDSKHGYSLTGSTLRLTLIRASYEPDPLPEIGQHEVHVALRPFGGDMPVAEAVRLGQNFDNDLHVMGTDVHKGKLPPAAALITPSPASVILSTVKKAEAANALILRFFDPTGKAATAAATLDPDFFGKVQAVAEVDLLERPLANGTATAAGNTVRVKLPARGIATVMVRLKKPRVGRP